MPSKIKTEFINGIEYKRCSKCNLLLLITDFYTGKNQCKQCRIDYQKQRYEEHDDGMAISSIKAYADECFANAPKHKENRRVWGINYYIRNKEKILTRSRIYNSEHKYEISIYNAKYIKNPKNKQILKDQRRRRRARKHGLEDKYINTPFECGHNHHLGTKSNGELDWKTTVCAPAEIHDKNKHYAFGGTHNKLGKGMVKINTLVAMWYEKTYPDDIINIQYLWAVVEATKKRYENGWWNVPLWSEWETYQKWLGENPRKRTSFETYLKYMEKQKQKDECI